MRRDRSALCHRARKDSSHGWALAVCAALSSACIADSGDEAQESGRAAGAIVRPLPPRWLVGDHARTWPPVARMSSLAAVARGATEVAAFWVATDGSVHESRTAGGATVEMEIRPANSALPWGGLAAAEAGLHTEIVWVGPGGSIENVRWHHSTRARTPSRVAERGHAASTTHVAAVMRTASALDVFWVGADRSVWNGYRCTGSETSWCAAEIAGPDSASSFGRLAAVTAASSDMTVFWVDGAGAVQAAHLSPGGCGKVGPCTWQYSEVSAAGTASLRGALSAVSPSPRAIALSWTGRDGSVQHARGDGLVWATEPIAGPGGAAASGRIASVVREPGALEVFWIAPDGSIQAAHRTAGWSIHQLADPESAAVASGLASVSAARDRIDVWWIRHERLGASDRRATWLAHADWFEGR